MKAKKIFDIEDTAKFLGISRSMVYCYVKNEKLVPLRRDKRKHGDQLFFSFKDIKQFERPKRGRPPKREGGEGLPKPRKEVIADVCEQSRSP